MWRNNRRRAVNRDYCEGTTFALLFMLSFHIYIFYFVINHNCMLNRIFTERSILPELLI